MKVSGKHIVLSALRTPHSALRTPHVAGAPFPVGDEVTSLHSFRQAPSTVWLSVRDSSRRLLLRTAWMVGQPIATVDLLIATVDKASAAQVKASGMAGNTSATAGKPPETPVHPFAPVIKASAAATDASPTASDALSTVPIASSPGSDAIPAVPIAISLVPIAFSRISGTNSSASDTISTASIAFTTSVRSILAIPHAFSLTLTLSRWEREHLRAISFARRPPCLRPQRHLVARRGQTPSFSQREKAGMREKTHVHPPHPVFPRPQTLDPKP